MYKIAEEYEATNSILEIFPQLSNENDREELLGVNGKIITCLGLKPKEIHDENSPKFFSLWGKLGMREYGDSLMREYILIVAKIALHKLSNRSLCYAKFSESLIDEGKDIFGDYEDKSKEEDKINSELSSNVSSHKKLTSIRNIYKNTSVHVKRLYAIIISLLLVIVVLICRFY